MMLRGMVERIRKRFRKPTRYYNIDGFVLDMGENHLLSIYQDNCPMFSRFIPYLGELGQAIHQTNGVIIDLGANVGDTTAALINHTNADILCIEPTNTYYSLLKENIVSLDPSGKRIHTLQAFYRIKDKGIKRLSQGVGQLCKRNLPTRKPQHSCCRRRLRNVGYPLPGCL